MSLHNDVRTALQQGVSESGVGGIAGIDLAGNDERLVVCVRMEPELWEIIPRLAFGHYPMQLQLAYELVFGALWQLVFDQRLSFTRSELLATVLIGAGQEAEESLPQYEISLVPHPPAIVVPEANLQTAYQTFATLDTLTEGETLAALQGACHPWGLVLASIDWHDSAPTQAIPVTIVAAPCLPPDDITPRQLRMLVEVTQLGWNYAAHVPEDEIRKLGQTLASDLAAAEGVVTF